MKWLSVCVVVSVALVPSVGIGQEPDPREAGLRERIAAEPGEPRPACELGALLVRRDAYEAARSVLEPAVHILAGRTGRGAHRSLGACLYNLGRAYEGDGIDVGRLGYAIDAYRWSLEVRPNDTVVARLAGLAALSSDISAEDTRPPEPLPAGMRDSRARAYAAFAARCDPSRGHDACEVPLALPALVGANRCGPAGHWWIARATTRNFNIADLVWVPREGEPQRVELVQTHDWHEVERGGETLRFEREVCGARVFSSVRYTQGDIENGAYDVSYTYETVVWVEGGRVVGFDLRTASTDDGANEDFSVELRFDHRGHVRVPAAEGGPSSGRFTLEEARQRFRLD